MESKKGREATAARPDAMNKKSMNEQGFSENALKTARENLEMTVSKLKIFTEGRKNIFSDFINASSSNLEQWQKKLKEAVDAFSEANSLTV